MAEEIKQFKEEIDMTVKPPTTDDTVRPVKVEDAAVKDPLQPEILEKKPFTIDELKKVVRPVGQSSEYGTKYGQAFWNEVVQTLTNTSTIQPTGMMVPVIGSNGAVVMDSNPTIADGVSGQELKIIGTSAANTVTLKDGNGMRLVGACVLAIYDTISLYYDGTDWIELARTNWVSSTTSVSTSSVSTSSSSSSSSSSTTT